MLSSYHISLVLLSLLMAFAFSYQLLDVSFQLAASRRTVHRVIWFTAGTATQALGLWSLHFVAMLAWLPRSIGNFHPAWSLGALITAGLVCYGGLLLSTRPSLDRLSLVLGSMGLGSAAVLMHFMNLASIDVYPEIAHLNWGLATLTLLCGVVPIALLVRLLHYLQNIRSKRWLIRQLLVASGLAVLLMIPLHLALSAAIFPLHVAGDPGAADSLLWLGIIVGLFGLAIILMAILVSHHCVQMFRRAQKLAGSVDRLHVELNHLTTHDPLTGLPNRSTMVARIGQALDQAHKHGGTVAVIYIDLDGFKTINEMLGHGNGDELLRMVAQRLQRQFGEGDLARVGGDEFVAVIDDMRDIESVVHRSERLVEAMQPGFMVHGTELLVTASMGLAFYPQDADNIEELIANTDVAMYEAKTSGRNCCCLYNAAMKQRALRALQIQQGLQTAIENGSLSLHFQPKHDARTGVIVGAEALARWSHPELGPVGPDEFIRVAERSGQIVKIGEWVIRESCRQLCIWRERGLPMVRIAINLSPLQLNQPDLPDIASRIVAEAGLSPAHIMFEVTESMAMQDVLRTMVVLGDFRERGFEFAIDDFGTGYSSLAYLQKFRARQLKIDRIFVSALDNGGHEARAIITAIIALAHTLDMEVVAEGVETHSQMRQLREMQCDQIQGYLLSKPMSARVFEQTFLALHGVDSRLHLSQ